MRWCKLSPTVCIRNSGPSTATSAATATTLVLTTSVRHLRYSPVLGPIASLEGYVSRDVRIQHNQVIGGQYGRAIYAKRAIPYGTEIMNLPAFAMYVGDEPVREQCIKVTEEIYRKLATNHPHKQFISERVMTLMYGGPGFFFRERDCVDFAESIKLDESGITTGGPYLTSGEFTSSDLQKIPQIVNFNKWEVEYRGRRGICLFPEASYFNHDCDPNVDFEIRYSADKSRFIFSARTSKPVSEGEQLFISYVPGNTLPLSRLSAKLNSRWGFECHCAKCRSRLMNAMGIIIFCVTVPSFFLMSWYLKRKGQSSHRRM